MDLLGRRWALRILWELRDGPLGARALLSRCDGMSSSVLYERLKELTGAGLLSRDQVGAYLLTDLGKSLSAALKPLDAWATRWANTPDSPYAPPPSAPLHHSSPERPLHHDQVDLGCAEN